MTILAIHVQTQQDFHVLVPLLCFHFVWKSEMSSIPAQKQSKWGLLGAFINHQLYVCVCVCVPHLYLDVLALWGWRNRLGDQPYSEGEAELFHCQTSISVGSREHPGAE